MNRKLIGTALVMALIGGPVFAETDPAREIDRQWAERAKVQEKMEVHMEMMQSTMSKLQAENDPSVRKQLMDDHMQEMREMMGMMTSMPRSSFNRHDMHGAMHGVNVKDIAPMCKEDTAQCRQINAMAKRHAYIEREIAMMQMMMQQIMEHNAAEE